MEHLHKEGIICCELYSNATLERNFSKIRSTMSHESLNHWMIFPTHKEEVNKLNLKKLATDFVLNVPKRKNVFAVPE